MAYKIYKYKVLSHSFSYKAFQSGCLAWRSGEQHGFSCFKVLFDLLENSVQVALHIFAASKFIPFLGGEGAFVGYAEKFVKSCAVNHSSKIQDVVGNRNKGCTTLTFMNMFYVFVTANVCFGLG